MSLNANDTALTFLGVKASNIFVPQFPVYWVPCSESVNWLLPILTDMNCFARDIYGSVLMWRWKVCHTMH